MDGRKGDGTELLQLMTESKDFVDLAPCFFLLVQTKELGGDCCVENRMRFVVTGGLGGWVGPGDEFPYRYSRIGVGSSLTQRKRRVMARRILQLFHVFVCCTVSTKAS